MHTPVSLSPTDSESNPLLAIALRAEPGSVDRSLELARELGKAAPPPGGGHTATLWETLATIAAADLGTARAVEPHLDALAILGQAGSHSSDIDYAQYSWGVFAAEGGTDPLVATIGERGWSLTGTKPWCSLAERLDFALITAHVGDGARGLFVVDLHAPGVTVESGQWRARGLTEIPSGPIVLRDVKATPVREADWYLRRPGFAWGGIGVAACWYGGAVGIARTVFGSLGESPDPIAAVHLGQIDEQLQDARRALAEAAFLIDEWPDRSDGSILAKRVRGTVARACEETLAHAAHVLGPAPLALDGEHAKRVADLHLYIRQHHAEKDAASLGSSLARAGKSPW